MEKRADVGVFLVKGAHKELKATCYVCVPVYRSNMGAGLTGVAYTQVD